MRMTSWLWAAVLVVGLAGAAAAQEQAASGKELFTKYKCTMCHSIKAEGIEAKKKEAGAEEEAGAVAPPDLSDVGAKVESAQWIQDYLLKKVAKDGKKHKTLFKGTEAELKTLAEWLFSLKGKAK